MAVIRHDPPAQEGTEGTETPIVWVPIDDGKDYSSLEQWGEVRFILPKLIDARDFEEIKRQATASLYDSFEDDLIVLSGHPAFMTLITIVWVGMHGNMNNGLFYLKSKNDYTKVRVFSGFDQEGNA